MAPTLFLEADDFGVGAEAVPGRAVVDGLEVRRDDVAHGQSGQNPVLRADRLHRVASRCSRLQDRLLPRPRLEHRSYNYTLIITSQNKQNYYQLSNIRLSEPK